ncbi:FAD-dependent monooxygenase [Chelatococcus sp. GCM10030263]|uniref:FAD-dependent monooxygenase n=1 Tax=Chelatococcus sp. GCM10030263 TaxID=3273387 RepID=UPI0036205DEF
MHRRNMDVLVVGAGPVGLTLAAELARHGVRCRIIDRLEKPLPYCRAIGVTPRSLEVLEDMGVARQMVEAGVWITGLRSVINGQVIPDKMRDLSDLPYGELGVPQYETERILAEHLDRIGGVVERGIALAALRQTEEGVAVALETAEGREEAVFRYVIGCDGAHSAVRHALDIPFEGDAYPWSFALGDVAIDWDLPRGMAMRALKPMDDGPPDMFIAIPLPERNRYRVSMLAPPGIEVGGTDHGLQSEGKVSLVELQAVADRLVPGQPRLSDLRWASRFRISMRLAARYRSGNVFLAGDAAHIHPPTGGQGMNTGIQDAYNLAWKLAHVLRGAAPPALLDSYETERRPVGAEVVARTRAQSENYGREKGQVDRLADTQIRVAYRGGPLGLEEAEAIPAEAPHKGDRAPDAWGLAQDRIGFPLRLFDVLRGTQHVLLVSTDAGLAAQQQLEALAAWLKGRYGRQVRLVAIMRAGAIVPPLVEVTVLRDEGGDFARAYWSEHNTGYLVRPDGYIAYHGRPWTKEGLAATLGQILTVRE